MKLSHLWPLGLAVALLIGCGNDDQASFQSGGLSNMPDCMAEQFPFEPTFLAAKTYNDRTSLYLQTVADANNFHDGVVFHLYDVDTISDAQAVELSTAPDARARGKMVFFSSCAYEHDTLELGGTLRFQEFDAQPGGRVEGELVDGFAVDARNGNAVSDNFTGSWSFDVQAGPPHQDFYGVPERP